MRASVAAAPPPVDPRVFVLVAGRMREAGSAPAPTPRRCLRRRRGRRAVDQREIRRTRYGVLLPRGVRHDDREVGRSEIAQVSARSLRPRPW